jgi:hypothetical protein
MRENAVWSLISIGAAIVLTIIASRVHQYKRALGGLALACFVGALALFLWPYQDNLIAAFEVGLHGLPEAPAHSLGNNTPLELEKVKLAFYHGDHHDDPKRTFDLGRPLSGPYTDRIIYARFENVIVLWFKSVKPREADNMYILSQYFSNEHKLIHDNEELPNPRFDEDDNTVKGLISSDYPFTPPLGPIASWCAKRRDCSTLLGTRIFQFEFNPGFVYTQIFERGIQVGPLPTWEYVTDDRSDILTIPTKDQVKYMIFNNDELQRPQPARRSRPACYTCRQ